MWKDESESEEYDEEEEEEKEEQEPKKRGGQVDLYDDDDKKKNAKGKRRARKESDDEEEVQVKQTQRPSKQKFKEIMRADDAFPTLENGFEDDDEFGDTPKGEIDSQE